MSLSEVVVYGCDLHGETDAVKCGKCRTNSWGYEPKPDHDEESNGKVELRLVGRLRELYDNDCPPDNPCTPEQAAAFKAKWDEMNRA